MIQSQTHKCRVSVVMSCYKEPLHWIRLAVQSILEQTFKDLEFIIVCDNPDSDECPVFIREICESDPRVKLIVNETNLGPTKSFNIAIAAAEGEYIARMDADDIALPERFAKQVNFLDSHPEISVCATDTHAIDAEGKIKRRNCYKRKRETFLNIISNSIAHPSVMFRKNLLELRTPLYNEDFIYSQDYELWQFLILKGVGFHTLKEALLLYRKSSGQISAAKRQKQVALFKKAHKSFILNWLIQKEVITEDDCDDLKTILSKASAAYKRQCVDRKYLAYIIYVLYFSLGTDEWMYRLKYLTDSNLIALQVKFVYTFRLFFSRKTRRNRTGFI